MRCRICSSPRRAEIEAATAAGQSLADVADRFRVSEASLERHITSHPRASSAQAIPAKPPRRRAPTPPAGVAEELAPDTIRSERLQGASARQRAIAIAETIDRLLREAEAVHEVDGVRLASASYAEKASLVRAAISANRQLAQLTGEIGASEAAIAQSPHYRRIRRVIVDALDGFEDARAALIAALEREERGAAATVVDVETAAE